MSEEIWENIYSSFPINEKMIWLNNCGTTSPCKETVKDVSEFLESYSQSGIFSRVRDFHTTSLNIKRMLSSLINCKPSELALIHNTSEGMNLISYGLRLKAGDTILLLENEYPSNVYPWQFWQNKGIRLEFVPMGKTPDEFLHNFKQRLNDHVKVAALSAVHWCTGMPLPVLQISKLCKTTNISLILDGAQAVGHTNMDLKELDIFAMAFPAWKWLLGPLGLGVLYINENNINDLEFIFKGQNSVVDGDNYLPYKDTLKPGTDRYEYSTPAFMEWVYFESSLSMLEKTGFQKVRDRIIELSQYLQDGLRNAGYNLLADAFPEVNTGITVFDKPGVNSKQIFEELQQNNIIGALRLDRIRLSPHIYNSKAQLDKVIKSLINPVNTRK